MGSSPGLATFFFLPCDVWWLSVGPCSGCQQQNGTISSVLAWFRAASGTNLIKQGENVTGQPCGMVAVVACSHGIKRETLGSSPCPAAGSLSCGNIIYEDLFPSK